MSLTLRAFPAASRGLCERRCHRAVSSVGRTTRSAQGADCQRPPCDPPPVRCRAGWGGPPHGGETEAQRPRFPIAPPRPGPAADPGGPGPARQPPHIPSPREPASGGRHAALAGFAELVRKAGGGLTPACPLVRRLGLSDRGGSPWARALVLGAPLTWNTLRTALAGPGAGGDAADPVPCLPRAGAPPPRETAGSQRLCCPGQPGQTSGPEPGGRPEAAGAGTPSVAPEPEPTSVPCPLASCAWAGAEVQTGHR